MESLSPSPPLLERRRPPLDKARQLLLFAEKIVVGTPLVIGVVGLIAHPEWLTAGNVLAGVLVTSFGAVVHGRSSPSRREREVYFVGDPEETSIGDFHLLGRRRGGMNVDGDAMAKRKYRK